MPPSNEQDVLGRALVNFARDRMFPEENDIPGKQVIGSTLPGAIKTINSAESDLEIEIRSISRESAPFVDSWIKNAKALEQDINRSRKLASDIIREAETGKKSAQIIVNAKSKVEFLSNERQYNSQVRVILGQIKSIQNALDQAQMSAIQKKLIDALQCLSRASIGIEELSRATQTRAVQLLIFRADNLQVSIREDFDTLWNSLIIVDESSSLITIKHENEAHTVDIPAAISISRAFKDLDTRAERLATFLHKIVIGPRIDITSGSSVSIIIEENSIRIQNAPRIDRTIRSLLRDVEKVIGFADRTLTHELSTAVSRFLMPKISRQIKEIWLDSAVPATLDGIESFQKAIASVQYFVKAIEDLGWSGTRILQDWVLDSPKIWLTKRRETSLDEIRSAISSGIVGSETVTYTETQTVSRKENILAISNDDGNNDWNDAWSDQEDVAGDAQTPESSIDGKPVAKQTSKSVGGDVVGREGLHGYPDNNDDETDAWGWGDDDADADTGSAANEPPTNLEETVKIKGEKTPDSVREITLTEDYQISSMPRLVLETVSAILNDAATLSEEKNEQSTVSPAAVGLFALPTLVLAMYRAVSPRYYPLTDGGNMYLYNDAKWLAEELRKASAAWSDRQDLAPRARGKVKLDGEIATMEKFGKGGYGNELNTQRTIINDLLGGAQSFLQQDGQGLQVDEIAIEGVVKYIRELSKLWKQILPKSAWAQAIGSLLSTVASKIILAIQDLPSLGADDAFRIAELISKVIELDDLFLPDEKKLEQTPATAQYVPDWLKLQVLSQVLQSDLADIKYLWSESDLGLYFSADEVIDLIKISFETSSLSREAIQEIRRNPHPRATGHGEDEW